MCARGTYLVIFESFEKRKKEKNKKQPKQKKPLPLVSGRRKAIHFFPYT